MKIWLTRSSFGKLKIHFAEPRKIVTEQGYVLFDSDYCNLIAKNPTEPSDLFPEVTFENSPMEVELKLIEK
jgi:hypothetical protein